MNLNKLSYIDEEMFTEKLTWPSKVLCINKKSVICSSRYAYINDIIFRANFWCKTLQRFIVDRMIDTKNFFI